MVCPTCSKNRPAASFGGAHPDECFRCHALTVDVDSCAMPTRRQPMTQDHVERIRERTRNSNAWERGVKIARQNPDGTVMPYLNGKGTVVGVKEWADNRRQYEEASRRARQDPTSLVTSKEAS